MAGGRYAWQRKGRTRDVPGVAGGEGGDVAVHGGEVPKLRHQMPPGLGEGRKGEGSGWGVWGPSWAKQSRGPTSPLVYFALKGIKRH